MNTTCTLRPVSLFALFLVASNIANAQMGCDALLSGGTFDFQSDSSSVAKTNEFHTWYCGQNFQTISDAKKLNTGATVPIEDIPIAFTFDGSESGFRSSYAQYCSSTNMSSSEATTTQNVRRTASSVLANAFVECQKISGVHFAVTDNSINHGDIVVAISYITSGAGAPPSAKVLRVNPSSNLICDDSTVSGPIGANPVFLRCKRKDEQFADLAISANMGSGLYKTFPALPPPPQIKTGHYHFTFCGATGCAAPNEQVGFGPPPGGTANGWCTAQDMTNHMASNGVLLKDEDVTLTAKNVIAGSPSDITFTVKRPMDSHNLLFCGTRTGSPQDANHDIMDFDVQFKFVVWEQ